MFCLVVMPTTLAIEVHLILYVSNQEFEIMVGFVVVILFVSFSKLSTLYLTP